MTQKLRSFWRILWLLSLGLCSACATHFGGQPHTVVLQTVPERARAYLIPYDVWLQKGQQTIMAWSDAEIAQYRVSGEIPKGSYTDEPAQAQPTDVTPMQLKRLAYQMVFVARLDDASGHHYQAFSQPFTPNELNPLGPLPLRD
jgi:hypothetical protein